MTPIRFNANVDIAASSGAVKVRGDLYAGGMMRVSGWGNMVVDLAGMRLPERLTLLADHNNSVGAVAGSAIPTKTTKKLTIAGTLSNNATGKEVAALLADNVKLQMSIGSDIVKATFIDAGKKIQANGRTFTAPAGGMYHVTSSVLKEGTITPLAADENTSIEIAARRGGSNSMTFEQWLIDNGYDRATLSAKALTHLQARFDQETAGGRDPDVAAQLRTARLTSEAGERQNARESLGRRFMGAATADVIAGRVEDVYRIACERDWSADQTELELIRASRFLASELNPPRPMGGNRGERRWASHHQKPEDLHAAAVLIRMGRGELAAKCYGERTAQMAEDLRCRSMLDICASILTANHMDIPRGDTAMVRAAFSTMTLPQTLGDSAHKIALGMWESTESTWPKFCKVVNVVNFKNHTQIRFNALGNFLPIAPGGEIKHGSADESTYVVKADTDGLLFAVTRHAIVNDDLSMFDQLSQALGIMGKESVSDKVCELLNDPPDGFFATGNGNLLTGATSVLSLPSLTTAIAALRKMVNANGKPLPLIPSVLLVSPENEMIGRALISSTTIARDLSSDQQPQGNPLPPLQLVVEPRLSNATFEGSSDKAWYLVAQPQAGAFSVAFLNGVQSPTVEIGQTDFNRLGIQLRGYLDSGAAAGDPSCIIKSTGVAP